VKLSSVATFLTLMAPAVAAGRPVQELFLGETSEISPVGEVQLGAGITAVGRDVEFPLSAEVGLFDHVEVTANLGESAAVHLGASTSGLSTYIGAEWSAAGDRMGPAWAAVAALGITRGRLGVHLSGAVDSTGVGAAAAVSFAIGGLVPIAELSLGHDGASFAAGAAWQPHDDLELGVAAAIDSERVPSLLLRVVAEVDLLEGRNRR
jgi:hypothetical protein